MKKSSTTKTGNLFAYEAEGEFHLCEAVLGDSEVHLVPSECVSLQDDAFTEKFINAVKNAGFTKKDVTIVLPRKDVSLRMFELPSLNLDELHDLIPLQAETRIGRSLEETYYDYSVLPLENSETISVSFVSTQKDRVDGMKKRLHAAGLSPTSAIVPELSLPRVEGSDGLCLDILLRDGISEITVSYAGVMIASKTCKLQNEQEQLSNKVSANWRILQAGLPATLQSLSLNEVRLHSVGLQPPQLEWIDNSFPDAVVKFGKLNRQVQHPELAILLLDKSSRYDRFDLIQKRENLSTKLSNRQLLTRVAAIIVLILTCFGGWIYNENAYLNSQIDWLSIQQTELNELIEHGQTALRSKQSVDDWNDMNVDWAEEIQKFCEFLPSTERIYLTRLQVDVSPRSGAAVLRVSGKARGNSDVTTLNRRFVTESNYVMHPVTIHPSATDRLYQVEFEFEAELNREEALENQDG